MGILDSVLDGVGDDAAGGIGDLLRGQGGVGGLAAQFGQHGLGDAVGSWISSGAANAAISPEQIERAIGQGPIADFAAKLGVTPAQASATLAGLLPTVIDRLTPNGDAAEADGVLDQLPGGLGGMLGGLLGGRR